jgi:hypothetical protein
VSPSLLDLIQRFRHAQDRGVAFVADVLGPTLGVRLPRSGNEWVAISGESGLYRVRWVNGVEVYSHGYGIELIFDGLTIDFDWGERGEPDGFDVWRLYNFARLNPCGPLSPEHAEVAAWIEQAAAAGELTRDRSLYYSPAHRAKQRAAEQNAAADRGNGD